MGRGVSNSCLDASETPTFLLQATIETPLSADLIMMLSMNFSLFRAIVYAFDYILFDIWFSFHK